MRPRLLAVLATAAIAATGFAQQSVHETRPANADAVVSVSSISGSVTVTGWSRDEVAVDGTLGKNVERLDLSGDREHLTIRVVVPPHRHNVGDTELQLKVPSRASVEVTTVSADIGMTELVGAIEAKAVSGRIEITASPRSLAATSVSGDVVVASSAPEVRASSVSGDLRLDLKAGRAETSTVSGGIALSGGPLDEIRAKTTSGELRCDAELAPRGSFSFESLSGDVSLTVPESFPADYELSTFSGDVRNAFGPGPARSSHHGPGEKLDFTQGDGGARIKVKTFSGDLTLKKR